MTLLLASVLVSLFVWRLPFDLSSKGGPANSYATAGIALRVTGVLKPPHHDKVELPTRRRYTHACKKSLKNMNSDKQISVLKCIAFSFSKSKSLSQIQNCNDPLLRLRLMFLCFLQSVLPLNWTILLSVSSLMGVQQLKDTFSILHTNLCTWLNILGVGVKNPSPEWCKWGDYCNHVSYNKN